MRISLNTLLICNSFTFGVTNHNIFTYQEHDKFRSTEVFDLGNVVKQDLSRTIRTAVYNLKHVSYTDKWSLAVRSDHFNYVFCNQIISMITCSLLTPIPGANTSAQAHSTDSTLCSRCLFMQSSLINSN